MNIKFNKKRGKKEFRVSINIHLCSSSSSFFSFFFFFFFFVGKPHHKYSVLPGVKERNIKIKESIIYDNSEVGHNMIIYNDSCVIIYTICMNNLFLKASNTVLTVISLLFLPLPETDPNVTSLICEAALTISGLRHSFITGQLTLFFASAVNTWLITTRSLSRETEGGDPSLSSQLSKVEPKYGLPFMSHK